MLSSSSGCEAAEYKIRDRYWCFSNWVFLSCVHDSFARVCGISPCDVSIRCVPTSCPPARALWRVQGRGTAPSLVLQQPSQGWGTNPANTRTPLPEYQNSCYGCHPKKFQVPPWPGCRCSLFPPVWHLGTPMELFPLISPNFACRTLLLIVFLGGSPAGTSISSCMAPRGKLRTCQVSAPRQHEQSCRCQAYPCKSNPNSFLVRAGEECSANVPVNNTKQVLKYSMNRGKKPFCKYYSFSSAAG